MAVLEAHSLEVEELAPVAVPGIRLLPVVHERGESGAVARAVLEAVAPAAVAVELPTTLAAAAARAVARLPRISAVISEQEGEDALVWVVAPGDPLVEALRWARERGRPSYCVDPDVPYAERHRDAVPDPYALWNLGPAAYLKILTLAGTGEEGEGKEDLAREAGMAFHLLRARERLRERGEEGEILALVGAAHARRLAERLGRPAAQPLARARRERVRVVNLHPEDLSGLLPDAPLAHAVWESVRGGEPPPQPDLGETLARKVSLERHGLRLILGEKDDDLVQRRWKALAYAAHQAARPLFRGRSLLAVDRRALGAAVWRVAAGSYREQTGESAAPWQRRIFFDFARRQARARGQLAPGLWEWVVAGRGVGDDNLAWEIFDLARLYPWQEEQAEIETARLDGDMLDLGTRKVRFRRRFFRVKQRPVAVPVRRRPRTDDPAEWLSAFDSPAICSYPPEDLVIEDYGRFLRKKAVALLSAENQRSEPFTTSMLDGIDIRETLRNLHEGRVYVRELGRAPGQAGSVVVIFDRDLDGEAYPYLMTWLGEHEQESDMAFFATDPGEQVVGPGITRATYGGFMMTSPPGRLADVWGDPDYRFAGEKSEVLLLAAIDYCEEKLVVHVAKEPPPQRLRQYAALQGKRLFHIPLGALSPVTLKKIRAVHILAGHDKRAIAPEYIW